MIGRGKKRIFFHIAGASVLILWLFMIGSLVKRVHFKDSVQVAEAEVSPASVDAAVREWKEIYLKDDKVGYAVSLIKPFDEGYFLQEEIFLKLKLMGFGNSIYTLTRSRVDNKFLLKNFDFSMTSGVVSFNVTGSVENDHLVITTGKGRKRKTRNIQLSRPPMIGAGLTHFFRSRKLDIGDSFTLPIFDPATMAQTQVIVRVIAEEALEIYGIKYESYRLEAEIFGTTITFWLDENGETLKEEGFMGLTTIRSSAARAPEDLEFGEGADLYEMTSIKINKKLPDPKRLSYLKIETSGIDPAKLASMAMDGGRQRVHENVVEIQKENTPLTAAHSLSSADYDAVLKGYLGPEFNIESDNQEIIRKAREISKGDDNPVSVTRKLLQWVYENLEKKPVVSIPSASETLRTRVGDCNEHATLLTALLRASGIPARISIGLVYMRQKFLYHAWTEAYVGQWISLDATLNQMPVDVTHIKFLEGNLERQVEIAGLIGKLKLKVLDYRYD